MRRAQQRLANEHRNAERRRVRLVDRAHGLSNADLEAILVQRAVAKAKAKAKAKSKAAATPKAKAKPKAKAGVCCCSDRLCGALSLRLPCGVVRLVRVARRHLAIATTAVCGVRSPGGAQARQR